MEITTPTEEALCTEPLARFVQQFLRLHVLTPATPQEALALLKEAATITNQISDMFRKETSVSPLRSTREAINTDYLETILQAELDWFRRSIARLSSVSTLVSTAMEEGALQKETITRI